MKSRTLIVPLTLPRLSDAAAAHLLEVLHEMLGLIEHHYGAHAHRHRKRRRGLNAQRSREPPPPGDEPF
jgi:hypothetical protein